MKGVKNNRHHHLKKCEGAASDFVGVYYTDPTNVQSRYKEAAEAKPWAAAIRWPLGRRDKRFATEREAAIQYDKWVLELGLDRPLNILKPKVAA